MGLRYWNQVDDDGESYWVFESRDVSTMIDRAVHRLIPIQPSRPANPVDSRYVTHSIQLP